MIKTIRKVTGFILTGTLLAGSPMLNVYASPVAGVSDAEALSIQGAEMPFAGVSFAFSKCTADGNAEESRLAAEAAERVSENIVPMVAEEPEVQVPEEPEEPVSEYADIAIARVNNYVNIRAEASTESEILGKLYDKSAATVLETTENGWYRIKSGSVTGYVACEFVVVGDEDLARAVSTRYATVTTMTLYVRKEPTTESKVLTMLPEGDDFVVIDESMRDTGWVMVTTEEGDGYVSMDYVSLWTDFVEAESREEEEARLKKEEEERQRAAEAAAAARQNSSAQASSSSSSSAAPAESSSSAAPASYSAPSGSNGQAVVDYACQFVGNPYVYGGSSLTEGTDCSGFVMSVYAAFGVSLPHSSSALRSVGYEVSTSEMQPGDIICYSGHVAIYVGNDTIVHASTSATGIKYTSPAGYKNIICVRRIF